MLGSHSFGSHTGGTKLAVDAYYCFEWLHRGIIWVVIDSV